MPKQAPFARSLAKSDVPSSPRIVVVGGLTRLQSHYCADFGCVDVENRDGTRLNERVRSAHGIVLVDKNISHSAAKKVRDQARKFGVYIADATSPGVGAVRRSISRLLDKIRQSNQSLDKSRAIERP